MYTLIIFSVLVFLPLPLMASSARKTKNGYRAIFEGVIGVAIAMMMLFIIASVTGNTVGQAVASDVEKYLKAIADNKEFVQMLNKEKGLFDEWFSMVKILFNYLINALPSVMIMLSAIIAYIEYIVISKISRKSKYPLPQLTPLKEFSLPRRALWGWIVIYLLTFVVTLLGFVSSNVLQINIQILFEFAFQIQGLAVVFFFCDLKKWPKAVAVVIVLLILLTVIGQLLLCMIGFLDLGVGLRKLLNIR